MSEFSCPVYLTDAIIFRDNTVETVEVLHLDIAGDWHVCQSFLVRDMVELLYGEICVHGRYMRPTIASDMADVRKLVPRYPGLTAGHAARQPAQPEPAEEQTEPAARQPAQPEQPSARHSPRMSAAARNFRRKWTTLRDRRRRRYGRYFGSKRAEQYSSPEIAEHIEAAFEVFGQDAFEETEPAEEHEPDLTPDNSSVDSSVLYSPMEDASCILEVPEECDPSCQEEHKLVFNM